MTVLQLYSYCSAALPPLSIIRAASNKQIGVHLATQWSFKTAVSRQPPQCRSPSRRLAEDAIAGSSGMCEDQCNLCSRFRAGPLLPPAPLMLNSRAA
jgi:hypothetical protein